MNHLVWVLLSSGLLFLPFFQNAGKDADSQKSDREKRGYLGPVRRASRQSQTLSRKLYRESSDGTPRLVEDTTEQFGGTGGPSEDDFDEFDERGRLMADASLDRALDQESFRLVYHYDADGRLTSLDHFAENGKSTGRTQFSYDANGKKNQQLSYSVEGVLVSKTLYDDHENVTENVSFAPDGSIKHRQVIQHTYRREGNTLEDTYTWTEPSAGMVLYIQPEPGAVAADAPPADASRTAKNVYVYSGSGRLVKRNLGGMEETYDENGQLVSLSLGPMVTTYSYDERGHVIEQRASEPPGLSSPSAGMARSVFKYDEHGNENERMVCDREGRLMLHYTRHYDYDAHGNWTRCLEKEEVFHAHKDWPDAVLEIITVEQRAITYY